MHSPGNCNFTTLDRHSECRSFFYPPLGTTATNRRFRGLNPPQYLIGFASFAGRAVLGQRALKCHSKVWVAVPARYWVSKNKMNASACCLPDLILGSTPKIVAHSCRGAFVGVS